MRFPAKQYVNASDWLTRVQAPPLLVTLESGWSDQCILAGDTPQAQPLPVDAGQSEAFAYHF